MAEEPQRPGAPGRGVADRADAGGAIRRSTSSRREDDRQGRAAAARTLRARTTTGASIICPLTETTPEPRAMAAS